DGAVRMRRYDPLERWPRSSGELSQALAVRELVAGHVRHPRREGDVIQGANLLGGQALPLSHRELAQLRHDHRDEAVGRGDDFGTAPGALKIARIHGVDSDGLEPRRDEGHLTLAER